MAQENKIIIDTYERAREAYLSRDLSQALYADGEVIMADVLITLHGEDHRMRRRLENRLYRRDVFLHYENDLFPGIIRETLDPHVAAGKAELVSLSHQLMMNLAALTAGVDRPKGTPEETFWLYDYLMIFIEGATLVHYKGDKQAKEAEIRQALAAFEEEFLAPGITRRLGLIEEFKDGRISEAELPQDVLTVLLRNEDRLNLTPQVILREIAFYLLAGAHTSATAFTRTMHHIFQWLDQNPDQRDKIQSPAFIQRCVHETIRLQPSSPVSERWAEKDIQLVAGPAIEKGSRVIIDLIQVNRDKSVFGDDAEAFNPERKLPSSVPEHGLSFGLGMHACIGKDLAAGILSRESSDSESHLNGVVTLAVNSVLADGCRPDPGDPPEMNPSTSRPYFGRYPVIFEKT
ncbi:MAG: cytochrome [SAR202 cluster bacterium Io17-Chloro-G4]|nr:MAG: cytochrome [SAR202 cluster bacterium Io17-Chloro-G4]